MIGGSLKSSYSTRENPVLEEYLENLKKNQLVALLGDRGLT